MTHHLSMEPPRLLERLPVICVYLTTDGQVDTRRTTYYEERTKVFLCDRLMPLHFIESYLLGQSFLVPIYLETQDGLSFNSHLFVSACRIERVVLYERCPLPELDAYLHGLLRGWYLNERTIANVQRDYNRPYHEGLMSQIRYYTAVPQWLEHNSPDRTTGLLPR
jgi:hypothetical protein